MFRTIAAAAIVFVFASFVLRQTSVAGPFEEPLLLLVMGSLFLAFGKMLGGEKRAAPALVERRI